MKSLKEILNDFHNKKILVIGDVMLDKYTFGYVERISPEAPIPIVNVENQEYKPGGAANVALNLANLSENGKFYLFGFIGDDFEGHKLRTILENNKINCYFEKNNQTTLKERVIGRSSGQKQHIVRIDREEISQKNFNNIEQLLKIAENVDRIIISDYAKGTITQNLVNHLTNYKFKMIVDPKKDNKDFGTIYKNSFLVKPNRRGALSMSQCHDIEMAGLYLKKEFNSNILITLGKDGMKLFPINDKMINIETIPEESFEETGAGDTTIAALSLALYDDSIESIISAAKIANLAAGITVKHIGTYAPTFKELEEKILSLEKD